MKVMSGFRQHRLYVSSENCSGVCVAFLTVNYWYWVILEEQWKKTTPSLLLTQGLYYFHSELKFELIMWFVCIAVSLLFLFVKMPLNLSCTLYYIENDKITHKNAHVEDES